jgi:hypothetical protein
MGDAMATPQEKLADSLEALHALQERGVMAIKSADLSRTHRERLSENGFLQEVMKGWYVPSRPDDAPGDSTPWYASFWDFCATYLTERFGENWCLSPEQSLSLHGGNRTVPAQLIVRAPRGGNKPTELPHGTSLSRKHHLTSTASASCGNRCVPKRKDKRREGIAGRQCR